MVDPDQCPETRTVAEPESGQIGDEIRPGRTARPVQASGQQGSGRDVQLADEDDDPSGGVSMDTDLQCLRGQAAGFG